MKTTGFALNRLLQRVAGVATGLAMATASLPSHAIEVTGSLPAVVVPPLGTIGVEGLTFNFTPGDYLFSVIGPVAVSLYTPTNSTISPTLVSGLPGLMSYTFTGLSGVYTLGLFGAVGAEYKVGILGTGIVTAVPEPESVALALGGLGVLGFMARRRLSA